MRSYEQRRNRQSRHETKRALQAQARRETTKIQQDPVDHPKAELKSKTSKTALLADESESGMKTTGHTVQVPTELFTISTRVPELRAG